MLNERYAREALEDYPGLRGQEALLLFGSAFTFLPLAVPFPVSVFGAAQISLMKVKENERKCL